MKMLYLNPCYSEALYHDIHVLFSFLHLKYYFYTIMTLNFRTDRSGQTVQTQIRLLLEEQSDQGPHYLLFHLHHSDKIPLRFGLFV